MKSIQWSSFVNANTKHAEVPNRQWWGLSSGEHEWLTFHGNPSNICSVGWKHKTETRLQCQEVRGQTFSLYAQCSFLGFLLSPAGLLICRVVSSCASPRSDNTTRHPPRLMNSPPTRWANDEKQLFNDNVFFSFSAPRFCSSFMLASDGQVASPPSSGCEWVNDDGIKC